MVLALSLNVDFAAPAKGNEKGGVEGTHGFIKDNFFKDNFFSRLRKKSQREIFT